jgi:hypothetical protein
MKIAFIQQYDSIKVFAHVNEKIENCGIHGCGYNNRPLENPMPLKNRHGTMRILQGQMPFDEANPLV